MEPDYLRLLEEIPKREKSKQHNWQHPQKMRGILPKCFIQQTTQLVTLAKEKSNFSLFFLWFFAKCFFAILIVCDKPRVAFSRSHFLLVCAPTSQWEFDVSSSAENDWNCSRISNGGIRLSQVQNWKRGPFQHTRVKIIFLGSRMISVPVGGTLAAFVASGLFRFAWLSLAVGTTSGIAFTEFIWIDANTSNTDMDQQCKLNNAADHTVHGKQSCRNSCCFYFHACIRITNREESTCHSFKREHHSLKN